MNTLIPKMKRFGTFASGFLTLVFGDRRCGRVARTVYIGQEGRQGPRSEVCGLTSRRDFISMVCYPL